MTFYEECEILELTPEEKEELANLYLASKIGNTLVKWEKKIEKLLKYWYEYLPNTIYSYMVHNLYVSCAVYRHKSNFK